MTYDYYDYGYYDYGTTAATATTLIGSAIILPLLISLAVSVFTIICMWKIFKKAGKQGWEAIIPIYNIIVLLEITELPMWYIVLFFIPIGNIVALILIYIELAKKFNKSGGFAAGLILLNPIFMGILAFDKKCVYNGNVAPVQPVTPSPVVESVQPTVQENPVVNEFSQPVEPVQPVVESVQPTVQENPVVNEFSQLSESTPTQQTQVSDMFGDINSNNQQ